MAKVVRLLPHPFAIDVRAISIPLCMLAEVNGWNKEVEKVLEEREARSHGPRGSGN